MEDGKRQPCAAERDQPLEDRDLVFVQGRVEDGEGYRVIRSRTGQLEVGELRALQSGRPVHGEVVSLTPVEGHDQLFDVDVLVERPTSSGKRVGPAKVSSQAYRENWDAIFGGHGEPGLN